MCDIGLESAELWHETPRKARKNHKCSSCGGIIHPKATYTVHFSIYEGAATSEKICDPCREARAEFADAHDGVSPTPGYFPQLLDRCIADGDEESEKKWKPMQVALLARNQAGAADGS
jgi:predicted RNA-binding Zn-ribbon protein involved in translation (DUF1610 family)